jgi:hypothetical protein
MSLSTSEVNAALKTGTSAPPGWLSASVYPCRNRATSSGWNPSSANSPRRNHSCVTRMEAIADVPSPS